MQSNVPAPVESLERGGPLAPHSGLRLPRLVGYVQRRDAHNRLDPGATLD